MEWFKHSTSSHDDPDISDAMDNFGDCAYTIFFIILEIYGQEFNHLEGGWLDVSERFLARKLRKSFTKVELLLNFYSERQKWNYKNEYGRVKIKIPKFIDLASNWAKRKTRLPTEAPTEAPTAREENRREEEENNKKKIQKKENPVLVNNWKQKFDSARKLYPGTKRGLETEYKDFLKKNKPDTITLIFPAIESEIKHKQYLTETEQFCPCWKNFSTWINQKCWETEFPEQPKQKGIRYV